MNDMIENLEFLVPEKITISISRSSPNRKHLEERKQTGSSTISSLYYFHWNIPECVWPTLGMIPSEFQNMV